MPQSRPGSAAVGEETVDQRLHPGEDHLGSRGDVRRFRDMVEDPAGEIGRGDVDARRPQVGNEDVAGRPLEDELARPPAARARSDARFGQEAAVDELGDALGDDRPAQPGSVSDVRP